MTINEESWTSAIQAIRSATQPVLSCHVGPDGDALGSMIALGLALKGQGVRVSASYSEPFVIPKQYTFLPGLDLLLPPASLPAEPDLMITFDAGSMDRLGDLSVNAGAAKTLIVIDHHRSNDNFGTINLIDPNAAASAVIVHELLKRMEISLTTEIAACLYTALVTDTGRFQYQNTTPAVMQIAADLLSYNIEHDKIARIVYDTHPAAYLRLLSAALDRAEVMDVPSMIWTWVENADLHKAGIGLDDTEGLIDVVRTAEEAEVALVMKQMPEGHYKVSMRSKGATDVGAVCQAFGGGGHALAAGFTSDSDDPRAVANAIAAKLRA